MKYSMLVQIDNIPIMPPREKKDYEHVNSHQDNFCWGGCLENRNNY